MQSKDCLWQGANKNLILLHTRHRNYQMPVSSANQAVFSFQVRLPELSWSQHTHKLGWNVLTSRACPTEGKKAPWGFTMNRKCVSWMWLLRGTLERLLSHGFIFCSDSYVVLTHTDGKQSFCRHCFQVWCLCKLLWAKTERNNKAQS